MSLGDVIFDFFSNLGTEWALLGLLLIFVADALMIPTVPDIMFVVFVAAKPTVEFGLLSLGVTAAGELIGVFTLYTIVRHITVPNKIKRYANKYADFLLVSDERILFISRFAPMIVAPGAFIALMQPRWSTWKCAFWILLGCVIKYGAVMICCVWLGMAFDAQVSQRVMIIAAIAMIVISFIINYRRKKKRDFHKNDGKTDPEPVDGNTEE